MGYRGSFCFWRLFMIQKRLICLSVLFSLNFALAQLELKPYLDKPNEVILDLPVGWKISRYQADNILVASRENREDAPTIQVMALPYVESPENDPSGEKPSKSIAYDLLLMLAFQGMKQDATSELNIIEEKEVSEGLGKLMIIETSVASDAGGQIPVRLALLLEDSPQRELTIVAMFAATPEEFEVFDGEEFLMKITNSIQPLRLRGA